MQKGPILMEPITIKARLNQAYHFSGAAGNGIRFSDLSDGAAFVSARTHRLYTTVLFLQEGASATRPPSV